MKKQKIQLGIMLAVIIAVLGAYFGVDKYVAYTEEKSAREEAAAVIYLTDLEVSTIEEITYEYSGERNTFVKENDVWTYPADTTIELQQEKISAMAETLAQVTVEDKIEGVTDLAQYGLAEPSRSFSFKENGTEHVWHLGDLNEFTNVYYIYDEADSSTVYTVTSAFFSDFNYSITDLAVVEETTETESTEIVE